MKLLTKFNIAGAGLAFYFFIVNALYAMAAGTGATPVPIPTDPNAPIKSVGGFIDFVNKIATITSYLFWGLTVIFIFYAAFLYLTGGAEEEKIKKAHKQLIYAVIAIVVALFAYGLPHLVLTTLSPDSSSSSPGSTTLPGSAFEGQHSP